MDDATLTYDQAPHPYTPAVACGDLVFVAGRLGVADGVFADGIDGQVRNALHNVDRELSAFGLGLADTVKVTVFLSDMRDLQAMNRVYAELVPEPRPARSCVAVAALPFGSLVEIEAVASRDREAGADARPPV